jgi:putative RNA 2'-phosphotransferase
MVSNFRSKEDRYKAGRALSRLLREQAPNLLEVDRYGYAAFEAVVYAMKSQGLGIEAVHLLEIISKDPQHRFELFCGTVRAKAGHKYKVEPTSDPLLPPEFLYHGTSSKSFASIRSNGILPMGKAYVHLSSTVARARIIGLRKSKTPVILRVKSLEAHSVGIRFWRSGQISPDGEVFLSDYIPSSLVELIEE